MTTEGRFLFYSFCQWTKGGVAATPIVDVYSALSGIGGATKPGLIMWLRNKRVSAELDGNINKANLYQAYETALANDDSSRFKELARQKARVPLLVSGRFPPPGDRRVNLTSTASGRRKVIRV